MATYVTKKMIMDRMMSVYPTTTIGEFMANEHFKVTRKGKTISTSLYGEYEYQQEKKKPFYGKEEYKEIIPIINEMRESGKHTIKAYQREIFNRTRKNVPASLLGKILRAMGATPSKTTEYRLVKVNIF